MKYKSSYKSALKDLSVHAFLLCLSFYSLWYFRNSMWSIVTILLLGLLNVKTFIIFHDCGHNSYMPNRILNNIIGIVTGILVQTPLSWNFRHDTHHASSGNIENKYNWRYNEHIYYTLSEYKNLSSVKRKNISFFYNTRDIFSICAIIEFCDIGTFLIYKNFL